MKKTILTLAALSMMAAGQAQASLFEDLGVNSYYQAVQQQC